MQTDAAILAHVLPPASRDASSLPFHRWVTFSHSRLVPGPSLSVREIVSNPFWYQ